MMKDGGGFSDVISGKMVVLNVASMVGLVNGGGQRWWHGCGPVVVLNV